MIAGLICPRCSVHPWSQSTTPPSTAANASGACRGVAIRASYSRELPPSLAATGLSALYNSSDVAAPPSGPGIRLGLARGQLVPARAESLIQCEEADVVNTQCARPCWYKDAERDEASLFLASHASDDVRGHEVREGNPEALRGCRDDQA